MANDLQNNLKRFMNEYGSELAICRKEGKYSSISTFGDFIKNEIINKYCELVDLDKFFIPHRVGNGKWPIVPYIAIFNKKITRSAKEGVYIVYLLNKDTKELYLTLNQGTAAVKGRGRIRRLQNNAEQIRFRIGQNCRLQYGKVETGDTDYDAACIYFKKYTLSDIPDDNGLREDLKEFIGVYDVYYEQYYGSKTKGIEEGKEEINAIHVLENIENDEGKEEMNSKQALECIKRYISGKGFLFSDDLIENFYLCLKTKPFVLLAGTSGTGKTRLVRLFAEAIGAVNDGRYLQVAVKPDWSDSTDLFGHIDLEGGFVPGAIIEFIKKASENRNYPYILCLDEMNLARVEYYFSDFLSVIETRDWGNKEIKTDRLVPKVCYSGNGKATEQYEDLCFPDNLYVVGTVNMDETTFPFSKKVLDRANTIEFSDVDFTLPDHTEGQNESYLMADNSFLRSEYIRLLTDCSDHWESVIKYNDQIARINEILKEADIHFGYRTRDEMIFYLVYSEEADLIREDDAFDNQILQKILPRIQGSYSTLVEILKKLFRDICAGQYDVQNGSSDSLKMENYLKEGGYSKYPRSAQKICKMLRRFEEDDFTSFWI